MKYGFVLVVDNGSLAYILFDYPIIQIYYSCGRNDAFHGTVSVEYNGGESNYWVRGLAPLTAKG